MFDSLLMGELLARDGKVCPRVENMAVAGARDAHQPGFDGPREGRTTVTEEDVVRALLVDVFGVDQQAVHVEDAGPDRQAGTW